MLWTLAIETVRKKHDETVLHVPLSFTGDEELIDNNLSTVGEISKLSFPKAKGVWIGLSITKLISQYSKLRKMGVRSNKLSPDSLWHSIVNWSVLSILILVEHMSMSVREGSSLNILT
jgi:hypothetical protein